QTRSRCHGSCYGAYNLSIVFLAGNCRRPDGMPSLGDTWLCAATETLTSAHRVASVGLDPSRYYRARAVYTCASSMHLCPDAGRREASCTYGRSWLSQLRISVWTIRSDGGT